MHLDERGVALLGDVPQGLPMPALPSVTRADIHEILPLAMACFMLAAVETTAIGRMFAAKHGYRLERHAGIPRDRRPPISPPASAADSR